jgi:hypothetical protein
MLSWLLTRIHDKGRSCIIASEGMGLLALCCRFIERRCKEDLDLQHPSCMLISQSQRWKECFRNPILQLSNRKGGQCLCLLCGVPSGAVSHRNVDASGTSLVSPDRQVFICLIAPLPTTQRADRVPACKNIFLSRPQSRRRAQKISWGRLLDPLPALQKIFASTKTCILHLHLFPRQPPAHHRGANPLIYFERGIRL